MNKTVIKRRRRILLSGTALVCTFLLFAAGHTAQAQNTEALDTLLRDAVEGGQIPGVVAMAATSEGVLYTGAFGVRSTAADLPMQHDSIFRIASMTKAITSVAAMQLVEEGRIGLDDPVAPLLPFLGELQILEGFDEDTGAPLLRPATTPVTLRHLLTHTAGFGYAFSSKRLDDAEVRRLIQHDRPDGFIHAPILAEPGTEWNYGVSTDWVGRVIEVLREKALNKVFREHILEPLQMRDTFFKVPGGKAERRAALSRRASNGLLTELPLRPPTSSGFFSGGGGLSSTAGDYTRFMRALLRGGELDGARILKPETIALMAQNHIGELEAGTIPTVDKKTTNDIDILPHSVDRFGLGFLINTEPVEGGRSAGSLAWAGINNTYYWIDPERDICGVLMAQILPFFDEDVLNVLDAFERGVYALAPTNETRQEP